MTHTRSTRNALLVALGVVLALAPAAAGAGGTTPRVAFVGGSGGISASAAAAAARAAAEAAREAGVHAVFPDEVARALRATPDAMNCGTDAACAIATCGSVGADFVLAATVTDTGSAWVIEMRLRDGKRGSVRGQGSETVAREGRVAREASARLAQRLIRPLLFSGELPPPVGIPHAAAPTATTTSRSSLDAQLEATTRAAPQPAPSIRRRLGTVLAGSGATLLAGGAVAGALAWSAANDANASLARGDLGGFALGRRSSRTLAWTGAALGAAGGVALAAGAWLRFGGGSSRVAIGLEPGAVGARVAVAF